MLVYNISDTKIQSLEVGLKLTKALLGVGRMERS